MNKHLKYVTIALGALSLSAPALALAPGHMKQAGQSAREYAAGHGQLTKQTGSQKKHKSQRSKSGGASSGSSSGSSGSSSTRGGGSSSSGY